MKKLLAVILLCAFLLNGCSLLYRVYDSSDSAPIRQLTEADSIVKLDIYPENSGFDIPKPFDRPDFNLLTKTQQSIYIALDNAVYTMSTKYIPLGECSEEDVDIAYMALRNDRPEYFWLPTTYYLRTTDTHQEVCFAKSESEWLYTKAQRSETEHRLKTRIGEILSKAPDYSSQFELELYLHDSLVNTVTYDFNAAETPDKNHYAWNIDGALLKGKAVCEGYAKAMQVLLIATGFECGLVFGDSDGPHVWNSVKIDGHWYHLDPTHNDSGDLSSHFFFNVTTDYMRHSRTVYPTLQNATEAEIEDDNYNLFLPHCTNETKNYHVVNDLYIGSKAQVESTVVSIVCDAVRNGRRSVEFAVSEDMGFVFGEADADKFFDIGRCISAANAELTKKQQLRTYTYGGVEGALGFMISW